MWRTTRNACGRSGGRAVTRRCRVSTPPAEAPIATTRCSADESRAASAMNPQYVARRRPAGDFRAKRRLPARTASAAAGVDGARARHRHAFLRELVTVTEPCRDAADVGLLLGEHERDPVACAARAARAADAMDVALV